MANRELKKESVIHSSRFFLTTSQKERNKVIDRMFDEQPALLEFMQYLDRSIQNEMTKEVILQLMAIFYHSISFQQIRMNRISFDSLMNFISKSIEMKNYFHNANYSFDTNAAKMFYAGYPQKEILNYTHFALNNQFREYIKTENDGVFIFYILKALGEVFNDYVVKTEGRQ